MLARLTPGRAAEACPGEPDHRAWIVVLGAHRLVTSAAIARSTAVTVSTLCYNCVSSLFRRRDDR
jgi:hypothetical protein